MIGFQDHYISPFRRLLHCFGDGTAVCQVGTLLISAEDLIAHRIRCIMRDPEGLDLQAAQGTAPGNHPHLGTGQPPPYRKLGPGPFIGKDGDLAVVSGKHIQTGHMVLVFMGQENPAEGFRLQAAGPESLDDPPTGNPRID